MIRPLPLYIGLRYTRAKRRNHFISFISFASTIGIALGVAVLITVLSVMNGFDEQIRQHFFALAPQITIIPQVNDSIGRQPDVVASAPFLSGEGMLIQGKTLRGVTIMGIDPTQEQQVFQLSSQFTNGNLTTLIPGNFHVVITQNVADQLHLKMDQSINVFTSQVVTTPLRLFPRYRA